MNSGLRAFATAAMVAATGLALAAPDKVFVADEGAGTVSVLDAASFKKIAAVPVGREPHNVVATIAVGAYPHGIRISPDGKEAYVANLKGGTVSVIDTAARKEVAQIPVGKGPAQTGFAPDGRLAFVSLSQENKVALIDPAARKVVKTIAVGTVPIQVYATPDSKTLFVANQGTKQKPGKTVSVINLPDAKVVKTVQTGPGAHGVVVDREGRYAYVSNIYENSVSVLDVKSAKVVANVRVGEGPNGISVTP